MSRLRILAEYLFYSGWRRDGVYLTNDGEGFVIMYENKGVLPDRKELFLKLCLIFKVFTVARIYKVARIESMINSKRDKKSRSLYIWLMGVSDKSLGSNNAREMMKFVFSVSDEQQLPICVETSIERNAKIYSRFGFESYHLLDRKNDNIKVWFMCRKPVGQARQIMRLTLSPSL